MSPAKQLAAFLSKYTPRVAAEAKKALAAMRQRLPGAVELVYDNYNALVIGFGPTERPSDAVFSIAVLPTHVSLCFLQDAGTLPDPAHLLIGAGRVSRHIKLTSAAQLGEPVVQALMSAAMARPDVPMDGRGHRRLIIRSISAKQRPRRPRRI